MTPIDVYHGQCDVYCRTKKGFDRGQYIQNKCACLNYYDFDELNEKVIIWNHGRKKEPSVKKSVLDWLEE